MKVAFTKSIIDPEFPCKMEGYHEKRFCLFQKNEDGLPVDPMRTAYAGRDNLEMNTLLIVPDEGPAMVIHVGDLIMYDKDFVDDVKKVLCKKFDMKEDQFILTCTHTHSSPLVTRGLFGDLHPSEAYHDLLTEKMVENTKYCLEHQKECVLMEGEIELDDGIVASRHGVDKPYYKKVPILDFRDQEGHGIIKVLNIGSHPTVLDNKNKCVSADFFGVIRKYMQATNGEPVMIVNGEGGDISTRHTKKAGDWKETVRIGEALSEQVLTKEVLKPMDMGKASIKKVHYVVDYEPKKDPYLIAKSKELEDQLKTMDPESKEAIMIENCFLLDVQEKMAEDRIHHEMTTYIYDYGTFRIVTFPSEIDTQLAKRLRYADDKKTIVIAYSNESHHYAVNKEEYGHCHESYITNFPYGKADEFVEKIVEAYI